MIIIYSALTRGTPPQVGRFCFDPEEKQLQRNKIINLNKNSEGLEINYVAIDFQCRTLLLKWVGKIVLLKIKEEQ